VLSLCLWHGATFLAIRCTGVVLDRAVDLKRRLAIPSVVLVLGFAIWTYLMACPGLAGVVTLAVTVLATAIAVVEAFVVPRSGRTFAATAVAVGGTVASIFASLYPNLLISSTDPAYTLTVQNSTSSQYSLQVMTWVAVVMVPLVLAYQVWTYWVFRARLIGPAAPVAAVHPANPTTSAP